MGWEDQLTIKQVLDRQRFERQRKKRKEGKRETSCCCYIFLFVAALFVSQVLLKRKPSDQPFSSMINSTDGETPWTDKPQQPQGLLGNPTKNQPNKKAKTSQQLQALLGYPTRSQSNKETKTSQQLQALLNSLARSHTSSQSNKETKISQQPQAILGNPTSQPKKETKIQQPQGQLGNPTKNQPNQETKIEAKEEVAEHTESTEIVELQYELPYESSTGEVVLLKNKFKGTMKVFKITYQKQIEAFTSKQCAANEAV